MKKIFFAGLIILLVLGITMFIRLSVSSSSEFDDEDEDNDDFSENNYNLGKNNSSIQNSSNLGKITLSRLGMHNFSSDCWIAYGGKVYDITSFLPGHPGSAGAIIPFCGTSEKFAQAFVGKHGTKNVDMLMKIGTVIGDFDIVGKI